MQETRKDLMVELEELMKILRVQGSGAPRQEFQGPARPDFQGPARLGGVVVLRQEDPLGLRQDDIVRGKSYQACKFSQVTKHQNVR